MQQNRYIQVRRLGAGDAETFQQLVLLFCTVFEMPDEHVDRGRLQSLLADPHFVVYAAFDGDEMCGGLTGYIMLMYYHAESELYLYDMAVATSHQRQGIGRLLIEEMKRFCTAGNIGVMFVEAHADDLHAVEFYRSTGGAAEQAVHFNYYIK